MPFAAAAVALLMQAAAGTAPPSGQALDIMKYYPERASRMGIEGSATLQCMVTVAGGLSDCKVTAEQPSDVGFGDAALRLAPLFKMRPATRNGVAVAGGPVTIPIRFQLPRAASVPPSTDTTPPLAQPIWLRKPALADIARVYPPVARQKNLEGHAEVRCLITAGGELRPCVIGKDEPADQDFGAAALRLMPMFKMQPLDATGAKVEGRYIVVPVDFKPTN